MALTRQQIEQGYQSVFGGPVDPEGLRHFSSSEANWMTYDQFLNDLRGSDEFRQGLHLQPGGRAYKAPTAPTADNGFGTGVKPKFTYNPSPNEYDTELERLKNEYGTGSKTVIDPNQIYQDKLKMFQAQIDATKQIYADMISKERVRGEGRLGSGRAIQARSGLLGSDFGAAQTENIGKANEEIVGSIQREQNAVIQAILSEVRSSAAQDEAAKRAAKEGDTAKYIELLKTQTERRQGNMANIIASMIEAGVKPEDMAPEEFAKMISDLKVNEADFRVGYNAQAAERKAAADKAERDSRFTLKKGEIIYNADGTVFARGEEEEEDPITLGEGQILVDRQGNIIAEGREKTQEMLGDLTPKQATIFNSIVDKYNKSPLIAAADRTVVLKKTVEEIRKNPTNGAQQLNLVYSYIQALDTYQSAVREGELGLVNSIDSSFGKLKNTLEKIKNGQVVRGDVAKQIADAADMLVKTIGDGARSKAQAYRSQAQVAGVGDAFEEYLGGFSQSYNSDGGGDDDPLGLGFNPVGADTQQGTGKKMAFGDSMGSKFFKSLGSITAFGSKYWAPGLDIDLKVGDPIPSPFSGKVVAVKNGYNGGFGNQVQIRDARGNTLWFSHLQKSKVRPGQNIQAGQILALGGKTGKVISMGGGDGSHLDLTIVDKNGKKLTAKQVQQYILSGGSRFA